MAELDEILKRYTDPATGSVHGATFVAVDSKGEHVWWEDGLFLVLAVVGQST